MAQHGYLREYDEGWDRGDDRERSERGWRDSDRDWRRDHDRRFMFEDRDRDRDRDEGRGFFSRAGDEARSWFRDDERDYRSDRSSWEDDRDYPERDSGMSSYGREHGYGGGFGGSNEWREGRRSFSAHPDDHYRSWRDRQMQALDRDYQDYCREREQQFHHDFDAWRRERHGNPQPLQPGMTQSGLSADPSGMTQATTETVPSAPGETDPRATATLGTQSSGRGRR